MRVIGKSVDEAALSLQASSDLLKQVAAFNETLQALFPSGKAGYIPKGLRLFKSHQDANLHQDDCSLKHLAHVSKVLNNG